MGNSYFPSLIQIYKKFFRKLVWAGLAIIIIIGIGFTGFMLIRGENASILDPLIAATIMVIKTSLKEINPFTLPTSGKILAICLSFMGLVVVSFITSAITAFLVEGTLKETFWRKKMEKRISKLKNHYIVCGVEGAGYYILKELHDTQRPYILVDTDRKIIERVIETVGDQIFIEGDPTDGTTLSKAGIQYAKGIFAGAQEDNQNLVICLTAKHLNPSIKVVARCSEIKNIEKLKKAGADAVVSPSYIGGLRMASEMIRPTVVSFLDIMLRDKDKNLRVEEVPVPEASIGKPVSSLHLKKYSQTLLLAINAKDSWIYNPPDDYVIQPENTLIFITTPQERNEIERILRETGGG